MATSKPNKSAEVVDADPAPDGCIWMFKAGEEGEEPQRAAVNVASGSVDVMAGLGWLTKPDA